MLKNKSNKRGFWSLDSSSTYCVWNSEFGHLVGTGSLATGVTHKAHSKLTAVRLNYCHIIELVGLRTASGILLFAVAWQWRLSPLDVAFLVTVPGCHLPVTDGNFHRTAHLVKVGLRVFNIRCKVVVQTTKSHLNKAEDLSHFEIINNNNKFWRRA